MEAAAAGSHPLGEASARSRLPDEAEAEAGSRLPDEASVGSLCFTSGFSIVWGKVQ